MTCHSIEPFKSHSLALCAAAAAVAVAAGRDNHNFSNVAVRLGTVQPGALMPVLLTLLLPLLQGGKIIIS